MKSFFRRLIVPDITIEVIKNLIQFKLPGQNKSSGCGGKPRRFRKFLYFLKEMPMTCNSRTITKKFKKQQLVGKTILLEKIGNSKYNNKLFKIIK